MEEKEISTRNNLKKFINSRQEIMSTLIRQTKLQKSYKHPSIRSLLPSTCLYLPPNKRKIAILTGGSSGHEPAPLGYIAPYCLNTAVIGGIFSTPSVSDIINAIYHTGKDSNGILMIVNNYQGNSLSFGISIMKVKKVEESFWDGEEEKVPMEMIKVADDCSFIDLKQSNKFGYLGETWREKARGLTGLVYVYKVLGYWSEAWVQDEKALERYKKFREIPFEEDFNHMEELKSLAEDMMKEGGLITLATSLSSCTRFTQMETEEEELKHGEVDIGVGIHGGNGKERIEYENTKQVVSKMVRHIKNTIEATNPTGLIKKRHALMINNLGSVTDIEMATIVENVKDYVKMYGFNIDYISVGKFLTSLDTNGFSITVLQIKKPLEEILVEALTKETDTPFNIQPFPTEVGIEDDLESENEIEHYKHIECAISLDPPVKEIICDEKISKIFKKLFKFLKKYEEYLDNLDRQTGDGDLGMTISQALTKIMPYIDYFASEEKTLTSALVELSNLLCQNMKGTSGPLYAAFVFGIAEALGKSGELNEGNLRLAFKHGIMKMKELGKAEFSERTLMYVLNKIEVNWDFEHFSEPKLSRFEKEVEGYCEDVKGILPTKGMSVFFGEKCIGKADPGCEFVRLWVVKLAHLIYKEYFFF